MPGSWETKDTPMRALPTIGPGSWINKTPFIRTAFPLRVPARWKNKGHNQPQPRESKMEKKKPAVFAVIRRLLPWVAIACVILALVPRMGELRQCLERLSVAWLIPAFGLCLGYWFFNAGVWSWILESLGYPLPYLVGVRAWLTSESLRWLPGGVWKFASRVVAAQNLGIPLAVASLSLPVELAAAV